jgi:hypothetical protein
MEMDFQMKGNELEATSEPLRSDFEYIKYPFFSLKRVQRFLCGTCLFQTNDNANIGYVLNILPVGVLGIHFEQEAASQNTTTE